MDHNPEPLHHDMSRLRDDALASITGDSLAGDYERMAISAAFDDAEIAAAPQRSDFGRNLAHMSARAADAKFGTNIAAKYEGNHTTGQPPQSEPWRYFYDTELHWDATGIHLISIGIVSGDGREFYAHADQYDESSASTDIFLAQHVLPAVTGIPRRPLHELRQDLDTFFNPRPRQLWADFGAWDQVALMQIWGGMGQQPQWLPMQTRDVRQYAALLASQLPPYPSGRHNALVDAKHVQTMFGSIAERLERAGRIIRAL